MVDIQLHLGDCRDVLRGMADNSVDSIVTDPPYELGFMGKRWDSTGIAYDVNVWRECLRVLKPGGHLLAFGGSRTYHRLACAVEDAGFEIRDQIMWIFGSGFPKSLDVSKAIDKAAGAERQVVRLATRQGNAERRGDGEQGATYGDVWGGFTTMSTPATPDAERWQGWGTALKPAHEPLVMARKPLAEHTVAANVLEWGTGGLNVDGTRVAFSDQVQAKKRDGYCVTPDGTTFSNRVSPGKRADEYTNPLGRFPANVIHDGNEQVVRLFPETKGGTWNRTKGARHFNNNGEPTDYETQGTDSSTGSAARFFKSCPLDDEDIEAQRLVYCAKASKRDRDEGLEDGLEWLDSIELVDYDGSIYSLSEVLLWESRDQSPSTALNGEALLVRGTSGDTTPERSGNGSCTISYGKPLMAQSLTGIRFTTSTGTRKTIASKTLNSLPVSNTSDCTEAAIETLMACGLSPVESVACISLWRLITTSAGMAYRPGAKSVAKPTPLQISGSGALRQRLARNIHSTVKPTALMRYLCRLITPPGGVILDPFAGSGSTGKAAVLEGFGFIGIEKEAEYLAIAERRIEHAREQTLQPALL